MPKYIKVVLEANIPPAKNQLFTYHTEEKFKIGQEVVVPFRSRKLRGVVWGEERRKPNFPTKKIIQLTDQIPSLSKEQIKLAIWISEYYYCSLGLAVKSMLPRRVKRRGTDSKTRKLNDKKVRLTPRQKQVLDTILRSKDKTFLLHGVTGSGKTEIYLRLCQEVLGDGKQVMILVPEISLTHQAIDLFTARFPGEVAVIHSRLSFGQRFWAWERLRSGKAKIVIGPRSAVFAPVRNLGLIVLDEEHDSSFKQYDQNPRYHAREVALRLAKLFGAKVILGSATPSLESYYQAKKRDFKLLELPERIGKTSLPKVKIVDLRGEFRGGSRSILSERLKESLNKVIAGHKQAILFVNRRGAATFVFCRDCGYVLKCPNCDVSLTYHLGLKAKLTCHYCNFNTDPLSFCPHCKSPYIKYFGLGTQRVESELRALFPRVRLARFDRDSTKLKDAHKKIYYDFLNHKIDILVGTQMLAQGWDLPKVSLIGIILADSDLNLPDFRASERTFRLLTQVAGRTGRGKSVGQVILQTYNPDNFAISLAAKHNYKAFYRKEILNREELFFPPVTQAIKLIYRGYKKEKVEKEAISLAGKLKTAIARFKLKTIVLGPAPCFIPRVRRRYRYHLILMFKPGAKRTKSRLLGLVPADWIIDVDPESLL